MSTLIDSFPTTRPWHLGNYRPEWRALLEAAAQNTGFKVFVDDNASDMHGHPVPGCIAVWSRESASRDHGPFWREFLRLKQEAEKQEADA